MKQDVLRELRQKADKLYDSPDKGSWETNRKWFIERSYQEWAVREYFQYLEDSPFPLVYASEQFEQMMNSFACKDGTQQNRRMFAVAYDVVSNLNTILQDLSWKEEIGV